MKRFYKLAGAEAHDGSWRVTLDGRPVKTQQGAPQLVPSAALAEAMAGEWNRQGGTLDPAALPFRDMADLAIDVVSEARSQTCDKLLAYAETDTLCYRAHPNEPFFRRQQEVWEPLVSAFEAREGIALERVSGIVHRPQSDATQSALRQRLAGLGPFQLAPLEVMTSLAASLCVGLSALEDGADGEALWDAANLEEDWQAEQWGEDSEAAERRAKRRAGFLEAMEFARLARV